MNKSKIAFLAAVAISAAGIFNTVSAADSTTTVDSGAKKGCPTGKCGTKRGGMFEALGITTDQLEKMNTMKLDFEKANAPKKTELMTLSKELRDDMTKPGVSKSELIALQGKINDIKSQLSTNRVGYMADKMAILTDDQKAKIREFSLKRSFGPHHRGGHGGGHFKGKFHHGGKGGFHKGPGPRGFGGPEGKFGGPKPADAPASSELPSAPGDA